MDTTNKHDIEKIKPLFWEYDWESVQKKMTSYFVIARVLEFGTPEQFATLVAVIGETPVQDFLATRSADRLLSRRSLNYWRLYYEITTTTSESGL
ncbi:MAG: hypothetical protein BRD50_06485 [Bacteroidetes bacterium SW_11_45_7]|nr:MAG: hypothetical protein BRD50_06485 [Bacteroidetes bacterium SW_11_45_7]